jgi:hypothetical protein
VSQDFVLTNRDRYAGEEKVQLVAPLAPRLLLLLFIILTYLTEWMNESIKLMNESIKLMNESIN